ncbi:beta-propeller fold lactonase family protein, partial [Staphylococcus aureus]
NQLVSFRVDPSSGALSSKATVAASGAPTDLRVDPSGRRLVAPRFADDKVSVYSIAADGSLTLATQVYTGNPATSSQAMGPSSTLF